MGNANICREFVCMKSHDLFIQIDQFVSEAVCVCRISLETDNFYKSLKKYETQVLTVTMF